MRSRRAWLYAQMDKCRSNFHFDVSLQGQNGVYLPTNGTTQVQQHPTSSSYGDIQDPWQYFLDFPMLANQFHLLFVRRGRAIALLVCLVYKTLLLFKI